MKKNTCMEFLTKIPHHIKIPHLLFFLPREPAELW